MTMSQRSHLLANNKACSFWLFSTHFLSTKEKKKHEPMILPSYVMGLKYNNNIIQTYYGTQMNPKDFL